MVFRGQPGWRRPVLTKPTGTGAGEHGPAGPRGPAGDRGRGSGGGGKPETAQAHSGRANETSNSTPLQGPPANAHAMLLCPLSLPAGERKCVRSESGPPLRVFLTAAGALEKEWDGVGGAGVTPGSRTLVL